MGSQIGDLRRTLAFPDPAAIIKAAGVLLEETEKRLLKSGARVTEKSWDEMAEVGLSREMAGRGSGALKTELALGIWATLHAKGLLPHHVLLPRLLALLPHPSSRAIVQHIAQITLKQQPIKIDSLKTAVELDSGVWDHVLDRTVTLLAQSPPLDEQEPLVELLVWLYAHNSERRARAELKRLLRSHHGLASTADLLDEWERPASTSDLASIAYALLVRSPHQTHSLLQSCAEMMAGKGVWESGMVIGPVLQSYSVSAPLAALSLISNTTEIIQPSKTILATFSSSKNAAKPLSCDGDTKSHDRKSSIASTFLQAFCSKATVEQASFMSRLASHHKIGWCYDSFPVLSSFLLATGELESALQVCAKAAKEQPALGSLLIPVYLHRYSSEKDPAVKELIHRQMPSLATHHLVVPGVLKFCLALGKTVAGLEVCSDLWQRHNSLLSHFLPLLTGVEKERDPGLAKAKANFLLTICKERGGEQGEEVVGLLSSILSSPSAEVAVFGAAVEGIRALCWAEVMEVETAWGMVWSAVRRRSESRWLLPLLPGLLSLGADAELEPDEDFVAEALKRLWEWAGDEDVALADAALSALAAFHPQLHSLSLLPPKAKEGLKVPRALISTPLDERKPIEEMLSYIPGQAYLNLRPASPSKGFVELVSALVKSELGELGRGGRRGGPSVTVGRRAKHLEEVDAFMQRLFAAFSDNSFRNCQSLLGETLLVWYEPPLERRRDGSLGPRAWFQRGRVYAQLLGQLLRDVCPQPADWRASLQAFSGWLAFIPRAYEAILQGRISELEGSKGDKTEQSRRLDSAWLWARDQVVEAVKTGVRSSSAALPSALAALAALGLHLASLPDHDQPTPTHFTGPQQWNISLVETLSLYALHNYSPKASTMLPPMSQPDGRACGVAALGLSRLLPVIQSTIVDYLGPMDEKLFAHIHRALKSDKCSVVESFYFPLCVHSLAAPGGPPRIKASWESLKQGLAKTATPGRVLGAALLANVSDTATADAIVKTLLGLADKEDEDSLNFDLIWTALLPLLSNPSVSVKPPSAPDFVGMITSENEDGVLELVSRIGDSDIPSFQKRDAFHHLGLFFARQSKDNRTRNAALKALLGQLDSALATKDIVTITNALPALSAFHSDSKDEADNRPTDYSHLQDKSIIKPLVAKLSDGPDLPTCALVLSALAAPAESFPPLNWDSLLLPLLSSLPPEALIDAAVIATRESAAATMEALLKLRPTLPPQALAHLLSGAVDMKGLKEELLRRLVDAGKDLGMRNETSALLSGLLQRREELDKSLSTAVVDQASGILREFSITKVEELWSELGGLEKLLSSLKEEERSRILDHWSLNSPGAQFWAFMTSDLLPTPKILLPAVAWQPPTLRDVYVGMLCERLVSVESGAEGRVAWVLEVAAQSRLGEEGLGPEELAAAATDILSAAAVAWATEGIPVDTREAGEIRRRGPFALAAFIRALHSASTEEKLLHWLATLSLSLQSPFAHDCLRILAHTGTFKKENENFVSVIVQNVQNQL